MNGIPAYIVGNLTRDPEVTVISSGATLAKFTVACERSWKNENTGEWESAPSFIDVVAWRFVAEDVERLLEKGMRVIVTGRFDQQSWEDKDTGKTRNRLEVTADEVAIAVRNVESFVRKQRQEGGAAGNGRPTASAGASRKSASSDEVWG